MEMLKIWGSHLLISGLLISSCITGNIITIIRIFIVNITIYWVLVLVVEMSENIGISTQFSKSWQPNNNSLETSLQSEYCSLHVTLLSLFIWLSCHWKLSQLFCNKAECCHKIVYEKKSGRSKALMFSTRGFMFNFPPCCSLIHFFYFYFVTN